MVMIEVIALYLVTMRVCRVVQNRGCPKNQNGIWKMSVLALQAIICCLQRETYCAARRLWTFESCCTTLHCNCMPWPCCTAHIETGPSACHQSASSGVTNRYYEGWLLGTGLLDWIFARSSTVCQLPRTNFRTSMNGKPIFGVPVNRNFVFPTKYPDSAHLQIKWSKFLFPCVLGLALI